MQLVKYVFLIGAIVAPTLAAAEPIDFSRPIVDQSGVQYRNLECAKWSGDKRTCEEFSPVTLGSLVVMALNASTGDATAQIAAFKVIRALSDDNKAVELSAEQTKRVVDDLWAYRQKLDQKGMLIPLLEIARAVEMIDPASLK